MDLKQFILENSEPNEIWKDIPDFEDLYMISTHGRVITKERIVQNSKSSWIKPIQFLKVSLDKDNRKFIRVCRNNNKKRMYLGTLMAKTFLPKLKETWQIRFKDGNSLNCTINNIEWAEKIDKHTKYKPIEPIEGEIWKDIPGFENLYAVSNKGRIKSLERNITYKNGKIYHYQEKLLTPCLDSKGYYKIHIRNNNKHYFVHRLVASVFLPNPNNYPNIDHLDTNPINNCVENLKWVTQKMNMNNELTKQHLKEASRKNIEKRQNNSNCIPIVQLQNGNIINSYISIAEATRNGFSYSCIHKCLLGKQRKHKGFTWMYLYDYIQSTPKSIIATTISESTPTSV